MLFQFHHLELNTLTTSLLVNELNATPFCVKLPVKLISPATSKSVVGFVTPIPTLLYELPNNKLVL